MDSESGFHLLRLVPNSPSFKYSIEATKDLKISCHKNSVRIPIRDELGFALKFERFSQLYNIIEKAEVWEIDIKSELKSCSQYLNSLIADTVGAVDDNSSHRIQFLRDQLYLLSVEPGGRRYKPERIKEDALD